MTNEADVIERLLSVEKEASTLLQDARKRADEKVIAIGETGLDYHYERKKQHRLRQKMWFKWQIRLAEELKRPLILHIREAHEDAISILRKNKNRLHGGVCHCFVGDASVAKIYTEELGLSLGIGGYLLMQSEESKLLSEVVKVTPIEYLILETDGPFVKPEKPENISKKKWEHARNTSLILPAVASKIAMIKGIMQEEVMRITEENTRRVFMKNKINFVRNTCVLVIEVGEKRFYAA